MEFPVDLRYSKEDEWARPGSDGRVRVGITDFAQDALRDVVYVNLLDLGTDVTAGGTGKSRAQVRPILVSRRRSSMTGGGRNPRTQPEAGCERSAETDRSVERGRPERRQGVPRDVGGMDPRSGAGVVSGKQEGGSDADEGAQRGEHG